MTSRPPSASRWTTHIDHPQVRSQQIYRVVDWEGFGPVRTVRYPAEFASIGLVGSVDPPPPVGQDNSDILDRPNS